MDKVNGNVNKDEKSDPKFYECGKTGVGVRFTQIIVRTCGKSNYHIFVWFLNKGFRY